MPSSSTEIARYSSLYARVKRYYDLLAPYFSTENLVVASIIGSAATGLIYYLSRLMYFCKMKLFHLMFNDNVITKSENREGYEQVEDLLLTLCRDETEMCTIRGDDGNKSNAAEDDVLTHDQEETLLKLSMGMPPIAIRFVPGVFKATFFYVAEKDPLKRRHWINHIICIWRVGDPSLLIQLIPSSIRNTLAFIYENLGPRQALLSLLQENYSNFISAFTGNSKNDDDNDEDGTYHFTTWKHMSHLQGLFMIEAAHFHKQRMTKSLVVKDLTNGLTIIGSPRPMNTIAIDENSDINDLKNDVSHFLTNPESFKELADQNKSYQQINILYGPPGNGKSSILQALAIEHGIQYYMLNNGSDQTLTLSDIKRKLQDTLSGQCLVVFEDAESALPKPKINDNGGSNPDTADDTGGSDGSNDEGGNESGRNKPRFSVEEFLELFDGSVESGKPNGRLIFFTTNTPDALHHKVANMANGTYAFNNPAKSTIKEYWYNFYQDQSKDESAWKSPK